MGAERISMMRAAFTTVLVVLALAQIELACAKHQISELKRFQRHLAFRNIGLRRNQGSGTTSGTASGTTPTAAPTPAPTVNLPIATTITQEVAFYSVEPAAYTGAFKTLAEGSYGVSIGIADVKTARRTGTQFKPGCSVSSAAIQRAPRGLTSRSLRKLRQRML